MQINGFRIIAHQKFPKYKRGLLRAVLLIAALLIFVGMWLGYWTANQTQRDVSDQFNQQQAVIARNIAEGIEREFNALKKELFLLTKDISAHPFHPETDGGTIQKSFSRILESGVSRILIMDTALEKTYSYRPHRAMTLTENPVDPQSIAPHRTHETPVWVSQPRYKSPGSFLWIGTALAENPHLMICFEINVSWMLPPLLKDVRSGHTGYAWLIDEKGIFLFHPKTDFIGQDAFRIRAQDYPDVPLGIINFIQKEKMLNGQEGTGWYYSGWHRGITGKIKKLIAYCPVLISEHPPQKWAVAVAAPISEIESVIRRGHLRQYLSMGLVFLVIVMGAATVVFLEVRWSKVLEARIADRTEALKNSEEKYRSLVESAEDFIFTVDSKGVFQSMNSFTANFFGGYAKDFVGKELSGVFPPTVADRQLKQVERVYRFGKSVRDEFDVDFGDHQIWISTNFMPLKDDAGDVHAVLCIARDITDAKNLERKLINTEKLASMGTLAAGVAHEINNPLGVILGFCDLLLRKTDPTTQAHEDLETIERQGLLCKQVVENLLSFARLSKEESETSDLNGCIEEIVRVVKHTLEMNRIDLVLKLEPGIPPVVGDWRQLQQVFLNLINNAVSAMPRGGTLSLKTLYDRAGRKAVAVFQDTGVGIRPEDLDHIYEPFFTTKPEGTGTGLGLFVSYGIVTKFGGSIDCISHSEANGAAPQGTVFTIRLSTRAKESSCPAES